MGKKGLPRFSLPIGDKDLLPALLIIDLEVSITRLRQQSRVTRQVTRVSLDSGDIELGLKTCLSMFWEPVYIDAGSPELTMNTELHASTESYSRFF